LNLKHNDDEEWGVGAEIHRKEGMSETEGKGGLKKNTRKTTARYSKNPENGGDFTGGDMCEGPRKYSCLDIQQSQLQTTTGIKGGIVKTQNTGGTNRKKRIVFPPRRDKKRAGGRQKTSMLSCRGHTGGARIGQGEPVNPKKPVPKKIAPVMSRGKKGRVKAFAQQIREGQKVGLNMVL